MGLLIGHMFGDLLMAEWWSFILV